MGLATANRLRRPAEFKRVLGIARKRGSRSRDRLLLLSAAPGQADESRLGLAVSKRIGNSVARNRVKRRLREVFRSLVTGEAAQDSSTWDVVVTAQPAAAEEPYEVLKRSAETLMSRATRDNRNKKTSRDG